MGVGVRRPRAVLAAWLVVLAVLGGLGATVESRLVHSDLIVPGTKSADARALAAKHFGDSQTLVVLLEGPRAQLDSQGRRLAAKLDADPRLAVVGPWTRGSGDQLRPGAEKALVL